MSVFGGEGRRGAGRAGVCTVNEHDMAAHAIGGLDVGPDLDGVQVSCRAQVSRLGSLESGRRPEAGIRRSSIRFDQVRTSRQRHCHRSG